MPIPIPVPKGASCTASASVMKHGRCAACGCDFVYIVDCRGYGEGSTFLYGLSETATHDAREQAQQQAEAALQQAIASRTREVACPACGRVPPAAVARARALVFLLCLAPALVVAGLAMAGKVSAEMSPIAWGIAIALVVLGVCLSMLYRSRVLPTPPEPESVTGIAQALSRGRAVRLNTFDAIMAGRKSQAEPAARSGEAPPESRPPSVKSKVAAGIVIVAALLAVVGYGVHSRQSAAAAAADAAFAHAERRFSDAETAIARFDLKPSLDAYREAVKADDRIGDRRYHGKTFAEMSKAWEASYRQQIAASSPQLIEAALGGRVSLALADRLLGEFAPDAQQRLRSAVKERFDAVAAERAQTASGRGDMDALMAELRDDALAARWQPLRRRPLLDLAGRTYLIEFSHVVPDDAANLQPLDASAKFFESDTEQRARQMGDASTRPSAVRERQSAWNNLREPLETTVRDSIIGQANGQSVEVHSSDHAELVELGPAALAGAVRGRIQVTVAWGFQGFRTRGHDPAGRIQYLDKYVPREVLVVATITTTRGEPSTWDGRHVAHAMSDWTEADENTPSYSSDRKIASEKQLTSQVMLVLQRKIPAYKQNTP